MTVSEGRAGESRSGGTGREWWSFGELAVDGALRACPSDAQQHPRTDLASHGTHQKYPLVHALSAGHSAQDGNKTTRMET